MKPSEIFKLPNGLHHAEGPLYLSVVGNSRAWVYLKRINGVQYRRGLGSAKVLPLSSAKALAGRVTLEMAKGATLDEALATIRPKTPAPKAHIHTFHDVADEALIVRARVAQLKKGSRTQLEWRRFCSFCSPIDKKNVATLTRDDVLLCVSPIWQSKPPTAAKVLRLIHMILNFAIIKEYRALANPAEWKGGLEFFLPKNSARANMRHFAAPTVEELRGICERLRAAHYASANAILFGVLTCTRATEFTKAKWADIDLSSRCWTVPAADRKGKQTNPHRVPLSAQAVAFIKLLPHKGDYLFPGCGGRAHVHKAVPRQTFKEIGKTAATLHGIRSAFKNWATENGWSRDLSEAALSHTLGRSDVESAYLRTDLYEQRVPLMQAWADTVMPRLAQSGSSKRASCAKRGTASS